MAEFYNCQVIILLLLLTANFQTKHPFIAYLQAIIVSTNRMNKILEHLLMLLKL